jgi:hypothetical protein
MQNKQPDMAECYEFYTSLSHYQNFYIGHTKRLEVNRIYGTKCEFSMFTVFHLQVFRSRRD